MTIAPLARVLRVHSEDDADLLRRVDVQLARAALDRLNDVEAEADSDGDPLPSEISERLRADAEHRVLVSSEPHNVTATQEIQTSRLISTARAMVRAEQEELLRIRDEEGVPDAIVRPLLRALDLRDQALRSGGR